MGNNNLFKYIFAIVVLILVVVTIVIIAHNNSKKEEHNLDQTSTTTNIKTDLRFAISELDTINPILSKNRNVQEVTKIIYDPLVTLNENYKLEYCLASEITKENEGLSYIVKLRKGVLWENNTMFTVNDVIFTIDKIKSLDTLYSENLRFVIGVDIIDDYTLKINLSEPVDFFEYNLTFPIMCEKYYEGEDFVTTLRVPIGTGMFRISEYSSNVIKLAPNENYWNTDKKPMATEISLNLYNTIGEAYSAFKNGEIDVLSIKINNVEEYIGTLGYKKIEYKARDYDFLSFNTDGTIFSDTNIRKALSFAIDKNNIISSCLGTGYVPSNFSLDMGCWLYTKDLNVEVDTEKAAQILVDDGWERTSNSWQKRIDGRTQRLNFSFTVNANNEKRFAVAENIKEQLGRFSIPVTIRYLSPDTYNNAINSREYECILTGIRMGYSPSLNTFFGSGNIANYYSDEVADIMNMVSNTNDDNILFDKYNRLYDIYLDEAPYIGLYRNTEVVVYNQGLVSNMTPNCFNIYHNIDKWYRQ